MDNKVFIPGKAEEEGYLHFNFTEANRRLLEEDQWSTRGRAGNRSPNTMRIMNYSYKQSPSGIQIISNRGKCKKIPKSGQVGMPWHNARKSRVRRRLVRVIVKRSPLTILGSSI